MTRFTKSSTGKYIVSGKSYDMLIGTRAQVWHGTAYKTSGGLTKGDILQNKHGRIVSRSKHSTAKKENRLVKAGYGTKKGKFGFVKLHKKSSKMRGGAENLPSPNSPINGAATQPTPTVNPIQNALKKGGSRRHRKGKRGGSVNFALSPTDYDGRGVQTSGNAVQFAAGMGN